MGYKLTASKLSTDIGRISRHALNHLLKLRKNNNNKKPLIWVRVDLTNQNFGKKITKFRLAME